jgi:ABC-type transport system involved in multi-copper enzyme maturation permease subunit
VVRYEGIQVGRALRCPPERGAQGIARPTIDGLGMQNGSSVKMHPLNPDRTLSAWQDKVKREQCRAMTFLPIVERELRLASRRKSTFVIRCTAALLALTLAGFVSLLALLHPAGWGGKYLFNCLSYYVFIFALLGGVFLASDCLSRERREGTLGFLFLTDLKGYDVVLGKFMAISLNAFYGLLAVFPILGLSLLAGGVTGQEFGRMTLALINTLFFSIAAAMWVSSRSLSSYRAMANTICLLIGLIAAAHIARVCMTFVPPRFASALFYLSILSPAEPFLLAGAAGYMFQGRTFWLSLGFTHLLGWTFLGLAAWSLPHLIEPAEGTGFWRRLLSGEVLAGKSQRRRALLEINPVLWLLDDSRRLRWMTWGLAIAGGAVLLTFGGLGPMAAVGNTYMAWPFYFLLKVFFAIQACRFFSEARRTESLELLCATPLSMQAMVRGQWLALRQIFLWPVIIFIAAQLAAMLGANYAITFAAAPLMGFYAPLLAVYQIGRSVADFFAAGWFGMWLALTCKKPEMAAGLTILFVLILPVLAFCVPTIAIDVVLIIVARSKLLQQFPKPSLILGGKPSYQGPMV